MGVIAHTAFIEVNIINQRNVKWRTIGSVRSETYKPFQSVQIRL